MWLRAREFGGEMGGRPLPCGGALGDQPAALLDAFRMLDMMLAEGLDGQ